MGAKAAEKDLRGRLLTAVDEAAPAALAVARWMGAHPELSLQEHEAAARYVAWCEALGFAVQRGCAGMPSAFIARRGNARAPVRVALLAEMDALPAIGHACGHNLSGPASLLAAKALVDVLPEDQLHLRVVGCPAEELGIGKRRLVVAGAFEDLDAAMMAHASDMRRAHRLFLGNRKFEIAFRGRAAHAAAYPEEGRNALDAVVQLFVAIGLLRQRLPDGVRVHGIIHEGGQAPNVIPERAAARVWVRALYEDLLDAAADGLRSCAEGAARATDTRLEIVEEESSSPPMRPNLPLTALYRGALGSLGLEESPHPPDEAIGSSDITHVSRVVPTIHPNFPIGHGLKLHTRAFAEATQTPKGEAGLLEAARALALTVLALAERPDARAAVARADAGEAAA